MKEKMRLIEVDGDFYRLDDLDFNDRPYEDAKKYNEDGSEKIELNINDGAQVFEYTFNGVTQPGVPFVVQDAGKLGLGSSHPDKKLHIDSGKGGKVEVMDAQDWYKQHGDTKKEPTVDEVVTKHFVKWNEISRSQLASFRPIPCRSGAIFDMNTISAIKNDDEFTERLALHNSNRDKKVVYVRQLDKYYFAEDLKPGGMPYEDALPLSEAYVNQLEIEQRRRDEEDKKPPGGGGGILDYF